MSDRRMPTLALAGVIAIALVPSAPIAAAPAQVTIYRCTDAAGRLSLRDSPCRKGERQEVRAMLRPTDPPPRRAVATAPRSAPARAVVDVAAAPPRVVYVTPPRTTFECTTPDGERYASESAEGNPRWVPLWTLAYPAVVVANARGGYGGRIEYRDRNARLRVDGGRAWRVPGTVVGPSSVYAPAGTWIRDTCHPLPAAEACARLQDRRDALDSRYHSALQGDRDAIVREQRGIDARLSAECRA